MSTQSRLENWIHRQWDHFGLTAALLSPLSLLFYGISRSRAHRMLPQRLPVPVVVVGNIYVGGTGKTPRMGLPGSVRGNGQTSGI